MKTFGSGEVTRMTKIVVPTQKENPTGAVAASDKLLTRGGFVRKDSAGLFTLLPFGQRVQRKIDQIVREEMESMGAQEVSMPNLSTTDNWQTTGRLKTFGALVTATGRNTGRSYVLQPTHEENVVPVAKSLVKSKSDLPLTVFQIGQKFRDEAQVSGGILRGRQFGMADGYHFNATQAGADEHYEQVKESYLRVFNRTGVPVKITTASGGDFSEEKSHEFMSISPAGEDTVINCPTCDFAENVEVSSHQAGCNCPKCQTPLKADNAIEVGNTFKLGTRFTEAFGFTVDNNGHQEPVTMTCFGIGTTRLMAAAVEANHDDKGIIWPPEIAPYDVEVVGLNEDDPAVKASTEVIIGDLAKSGRTVLYDDRPLSAGNKFNDADLIGVPVRLTNSRRNLAAGVVEVKQRSNSESVKVPTGGILEYLNNL